MVEVKLAWEGEMKFTAQSESGAGMVFDTGIKFGGSGKYVTPMETVAMALASCSGMDLILILEKMRVNLTKLDIKVDARRREREPAYFKEIKMIFTASGDGLTEERFKKALKLTVEKYCSVSIMLRNKVTITYEGIVE